MADVVLVRDDNGGAGASAFTGLVDPGDGKVGVRVAQGVAFNFNGYLGLQRTGGDVALAVDPNDSAKIYVAYNADENGDYVLHLVRSQDRGLTWSPDTRRIRNALNPALAIKGRDQFLPFGTPGGEPYGALIGDYEWVNHPDDIDRATAIVVADT